MAREAALFGILLLLGSGPASFLSDSTDNASRLAMAPLLGFCLGTCVTTTILAFAPVNDTFWVLIPLAALSATAAAIRTSRSTTRGWPPVKDLAALALVVVVVVGPIDATLNQHHTVGPAAYYYTDVDNYVAVQDAARTTSLRAASDNFHADVRANTAGANLTQYTWGDFAQFGSNLDATPLDANANALLGLGATDTFSPFLTVLLLMGALGAFAAVRHFARAPTMVAALAAALFGGSLFLELWFDSYQAAIIAIGLVVPFLVLVDQTLREGRAANLALIALVLGTMLSVYPLYLALLIATAGLMIVGRALALRRAGATLRPLLGPLAVSVAAVVVLSLVFDPVATARDIHYYHLVFENKVPYPRVGYKLPIDVIPGWIGQTREFWALSGLASGGLNPIVLGVILPLAFLGFAVLGLRRYPAAWVLVALGAVCAVVAEYTYVSQQSCTYCAERVLLPLGPIAAVLIALGVCGLLAGASRWSRAVGLIGIALVLVPVAARARIELIRFSNGSYFMDTANRQVLARLPPGPGAIQEEGYGGSVAAQAEQPLIYQLINERAPGRTSILLGSDLGNAIQYLNFGPVMIPPGPEFKPEYRYVLTRLADVATDRRTIARSGPIALQERLAPLDITPYEGLGTPLARLDPDGTAWVQTTSPLGFYIAGPTPGPVWGRLTFRSTVPVSIPPAPGVRARVSGRILTACVRATGVAPERQVKLTVNASLQPGPMPPERFPPAMPLEGLVLTSMRAVAGRCDI